MGESKINLGRWPIMTAKTVASIDDELTRSRATYPTVHSLHHGLGVIEEEVYELRMEVYKKPHERDKDGLRREAVQVAATAIRFIEELT